MKNQLLTLALLVFACDTTGRNSVSTGVSYEKYVLDCSDPEATVEIDVSDYPVITYYDRYPSSGDTIGPGTEKPSTRFEADGNYVIMRCNNNESPDLKVIASVFRPN